MNVFFFPTFDAFAFVSYPYPDWVLEDRKIRRQTSKDRLQIAEKFLKGTSENRLSFDRPIHVTDSFF